MLDLAVGLVFVFDFNQKVGAVAALEFDAGQVRVANGREGRPTGWGACMNKRVDYLRPCQLLSRSREPSNSCQSRSREKWRWASP